MCGSAFGKANNFFKTAHRSSFGGLFLFGGSREGADMIELTDQSHARMGSAISRTPIHDLEPQADEVLLRW